jgi:hypothetical protein
LTSGATLTAHLCLNRHLQYTHKRAAEDVEVAKTVKAAAMETAVVVEAATAVVEAGEEFRNQS